MNILKIKFENLKENSSKYFSRDNLIFQIVYKNSKFIFFLIFISIIACLSELIFLNNLPDLLDNLFNQGDLRKEFLYMMLLAALSWTSLGLLFRYKVQFLLANLAKDLSDFVVLNFSNLSISEIENIGKSRISVLSTINIENVILGVCNPLIRLVEQVLTILVGVYIIYSNFGQESTVFLIFAFFLIVFLVALTRSRSYKYGLTDITNNKKIYYFVNLFLNNIREILLQKNYKLYSKPISHSNYEKFLARSKAMFISDLPRRLIESVIYLLICFIAIFDFFDSKSFLGNLPSLAVMLLIYQRIAPLIQQAYKAIFSIFNNLALIKEYKIMNSFDLYKKNNSKFYRKKASDLTIDDVKSIIVKNLVIGYENGKPLLMVPSLEICIDKPVAIIGESGLGKSTFVETLIGLRKPISGDCKFIDNNNLNFKTLQSISYIPQNCQFSGSSIFEMLSFGNPFLKNSISDKNTKLKIIKILKIACVWDDFVFTFDDLYKDIGEGAAALSGGQKQRITLARALLQDKKILIFDESTNGLDNDLEKKIISNIVNIKSKIIIFITHNIEIGNIFHNVINMRDYGIN